MINLRSSSRKIAELKTELADARRDASQWEEAYKRLKDRHDAGTTKDLRESDFVCDFKKMNAFAIERNVQDDVPRTIVGHVVVGADGTEHIKEWHLFCSAERHNTLASEFRQYVEDNS